MIVFDYGNGMYEVLFFVLEFGVYIVNIILDYILCDGFKDFLWDWFMIGKWLSVF